MRPEQIGFYPPYAAVTESAARGISASPTDQRDARERPGRRHHGGRGRYLRPAAERPGPRSDRARSRRSRSFGFDTAVAGGRVVRVMPNADFRFRSSERARGDHAADARRLPDEPEQPDRRARAARGDPERSPRRVPKEAIVFVDEAYAEFAGRIVHPGAAAVSRTSIVGRTFSKAFGLAGLRIGALVGAPGHARADPARHPGLQREHRRGRRACRRRSTTSPTCSDYLRQVEESKALLYAACDRLGLQVLAERRQLRAGPRRRPRRRGGRRRARDAASTSATDRREPGCDGCLRIGAGIVEHTQRVHRGDRGGPVRRAVIDRRTTETQIALTLDARRQGHVPGPHRHPLPRSHAGAVRAPRRVRSDGRRDRRSRRRSAPHRRGSRHRARRGGLAGARQRGAASTAPATS